MPDALLLWGALLAESSGITSPEENGLSIAATRDEGGRIFAPVDVEGRLLVSAALRAFAEVDMITFHTLGPATLDVSYSSQDHYHGRVFCGGEERALHICLAFQPYDTRLLARK